MQVWELLASLLHQATLMDMFYGTFMENTVYWTLAVQF